MIPEMLTNCVMFADGVSFSGDVPSMTLPKLSVKTEEYRGGGMSGPVDLPTGLEKLEAAFTTNGVRKEALKFFALADQTACNLVFRGSFKGQKGTVKSVTVTLRGSLKEVDMGDWKPGDKAEIKHAVKGPAVLAVIEAGFKVKDTYDNAETQDEKAEGYGAAAGGLAGTLAGAAAGAAIGSAVPVIGTILGGLIGGYLGSLGGDALGGAIGKSMFGSDESKKVMPVAGPLMMKDAGKDIPPVLGDIAKSFAPSRTGPLMLINPGQGALPATPGAVNPGDAARAMMMPPASADAVAAPLAAAVVAKVQPAKIETKVDIHAPITLTVQGDVKDPNEIIAKLRPLMEQQQREIAQQLENRKLYDAPHV